MNHEDDKTIYLTPIVYPDMSELNLSDQISVASDIWESIHAGWESERPIFVCVGTSSYCRVRPDTEIPYDTCKIPEWLWLHMGIPGPDEWIPIRPANIPDAKRLVLQAYTERSLTDMEDPVSTLTLALSGAEGPGWSCLNRGADLPLACGKFSIVDILDNDGITVPAGCILNVDLELDIVPAVDAVAAPPPAVRPPTPIPAPTPPIKTGFVPFSGVGRRLCD